MRSKDVKVRPTSTAPALPTFAKARVPAERQKNAVGHQVPRGHKRDGNKDEDHGACCAARRRGKVGAGRSETGRRRTVGGSHAWRYAWPVRRSLPGCTVPVLPRKEAVKKDGIG